MGDDEMNAGGGAMEAEVSQAFASAWELLSMARQHLSQGQPSPALQAVLTAMRSLGGEEAVNRTLQRAHELYRNKLQADAAADELASLFAECLITEAQPVKSDQPSPTPTGPSVLLSDSAESILAVSGRKQIMLDACSDGSSFICLKCGGLVSNLRKEEHLVYWCG